MYKTKSGFYNEFSRATKASAHSRTVGAHTTRVTRYKDPYDNLLYAILIQAAIDSKGARWGCNKITESMKFLKSETALNWWRYLGKRPKNDE